MSVEIACSALQPNKVQPNRSNQADQNLFISHSSQQEVGRGKSTTSRS